MIPSDHWYKNAIVYALDVETFHDSNADGIGDFPGLTARLDYLDGLGVTCLWLLPFYPTPNRDNGYDVIDYYNVDPRLGTLGDFVEFVREAGERGMRILIDLVANHTSDRHPWFRSSRSSPDSPYRDWYCWQKEPPPREHQQPVFPGEQHTTWTLDEEAGLYYLHHFYEHQPDLNVHHPAVRNEIKRIMGFWLQLGVSGFRVDAAPYLIEDVSERAKAGIEPKYDLLRELREFLDRRRGDAILLAEANVGPDRIGKYFGDGLRFQMLFNFYLNQHLFLALARGRAEPIARALGELLELEPACQWLNFVRNHDELSLDQLTAAEREEVFRAFAPDEDMRLYDRGIRRRLPPMLGGDWRRVALAYSLMFTLPGTPLVRYGEEIGMGDDLALQARDAVRTPMQWSDSENAGFSAPGTRPVRSVIDTGDFSYHRINVDEQERRPDSLLSRFERMIRQRKRCPEFGWDGFHLLDTPGSPAVIAHCATFRGATSVAVHNLSDQPMTVPLRHPDIDDKPLVEVLGDRVDPTASAPAPGLGGDHEVRLDPYGYRWLRTAEHEQ